jgi:hypothetical protein
MIDFQVVRFGHPLGDVVYFLYTNTRPEIRARYMTVLLRYYYRRRHYYDTASHSITTPGKISWLITADYKKGS